MLGLALLLAAAECLVPEGPVLARTTLPDGTKVTARAGELRVGGKSLTWCNGLPDPNPTALAVWRGQLTIGFRSAGVFTWDGAKFSTVKGLPKDAVRALAARGDDLWVGTAATGLWDVNASGAHRSTHAVLRKRELTALYAARDGSVHVGAGPYGWWRIAPSGQVRNVRGVYAGCFVETRAGVQALLPGPACSPHDDAPASGLASGHITALVTHQGALYAGTFDHGLSRRGPGGRFSSIAGVPAFINALYSDGETLFIGTPKGLYRLIGDRAERLALGLQSEHINGLAGGRNHTLWLATGQGLAGVSPDGIRVIDEKNGLPSRLAYAVAETRDGAVWAGTAEGAVRIDARGATLYTQTSGALPHNWVTALLPDGDAVLAGTYDAGVARLTADGRGHPEPGLTKAWINPNGLGRIGADLAAMTLGDGLLVDGRRVALPSDDVTALCAQGGQLWVGTRGGLVRLSL